MYINRDAGDFLYSFGRVDYRGLKGGEGSMSPPQYSFVYNKWGCLRPTLISCIPDTGISPF